jgi:hypothetical protein
MQGGEVRQGPLKVCGSRPDDRERACEPQGLADLLRVLGPCISSITTMPGTEGNSVSPENQATAAGWPR